MENEIECDKEKQSRLRSLDSIKCIDKTSIYQDCLISRNKSLKSAIDSINGRVVIIDCNGKSLWASSRIVEDCALLYLDPMTFSLGDYVIELAEDAHFQNVLALVKENGRYSKQVSVKAGETYCLYLMTMTYDMSTDCEEIIVSFGTQISDDLSENDSEILVSPLSKLQEDIGKTSSLSIASENIHLAILTIRNISDISFIRGEKHVDKIFDSYAKLIRPKFSSKVKFYRVTEFELGLVIETTLDAQEVLVRLKHFVNLVETNIDVDGHAYHIKIHGGVSTLGPNQSVDSLIRNASFAKEIATNENKSIEAYSLDEIAKHIEDITMADRFQNALYGNELHMEYQPIVTRNQDIWGYESLVRWSDQQYGNISALKIIEYAERSGSMVRLGYWIVRRVFEDILKMQEDTNTKPIVAINLSLEQFKDPLLAQTLYELSQEYGLNPKYIMFEVTESHAFSNLESIRNVLVQLGKYGFLIALDDFGVGYSTIMNLVDLPISVLKLDKSLIRNIKNNKKSIVVCESIVSLAHKLGLHIIAEGIETEGDQAVMLDFEVRLLQGFHYYKPLVLNTLIERIKESIRLKT